MREFNVTFVQECLFELRVSQFAPLSSHVGIAAVLRADCCAMSC